MNQLLFILGLAVSLHLQAQKKDTRLYGFSQGASKGIRNISVDEEGDISTENKSQSKTYLLYLETPEGGKLNVTGLWIDGKKYRFELEHVKTPVLLNTGLNMPGQNETVLIPNSKNEIIRIIPFGNTGTTEKNKRKIVKKKQVVVFYTASGKSSYRSLDKLEILPDLVNE
jgi:hypothetical protein